MQQQGKHHQENELHVADIALHWDADSYAVVDNRGLEAVHHIETLLLLRMPVALLVAGLAQLVDGLRNHLALDGPNQINKNQ